MLEKDTGLILGSSRSGETSLIATFLGRRMGKVRLLGKGILGPKHPCRGMFEPGNYLSVVFHHKPGRTFYFMKESSFVESPMRRRDSLPHLAALLGAMEILDQVCYVGSPDERIVDTACEYVGSADSQDPLFMFLAFEVKLLEALGASPEVSSCVMCGCPLDEGVFSAVEGASYCKDHSAGVADGISVSPGTALVNEACLAEPLEMFREKTISRTARKELGRILHWTYTRHVQGYHLPKSLNLI